MKEGWEIKLLGDLCHIQLGKTPHRNTEKFWDKDKNSTNVWLSISDLIHGKEVFDSKEYVSDEGKKIFKITPKGTLMLSFKLTLGRVSFAGKDLLTNEAIASLINLDANILKQYLFYYFSFFDWDLATRGDEKLKGKTLNKKKLENLEIFIPPFEEQKEIVEILDKAFEAIQKAKVNIEKNIENAKELLLSQREIFFDKLSFDKSSQIKPLNDLCLKIFAGGDKPKDFSKTKTLKQNIPVIANAVKNNGIYGYTETPIVKENSITVAARGSGTGHVEFRDYDYFPVVRLIVLIPDNDLVNEKFLMTALKNLKVRSSGSAIPQLTVPMIKTYSIAVPNLEKQKEIVETLDILDNHVQSLLVSYEQELKNLDELKKSILEKAFSGELTNKSVAV